MLPFLSKIILVFLPLFFWPNPLKFELPKVVFFLTVSFFLIIWFLVKSEFGKVENKQSLLLRNRTWFLWIGVLFLSTVLNNRFLPGLIGDGYRHQGVIFFLMLGIWMIVFSAREEAKNLKKIWWWISLAVIIESLIILGQWFVGGKPLGTFGEPNAVAGFLAIGLPILTYVFPPFFAILAVEAIIATGSKAGFGALLAEGLIYGYLKTRNFSGKKFLTILGLIIILSLGIFGAWQEKEESPFENRWLIWNLGIKAVQEKPVLGYGAEGIISVYDKQFRQINRPLEGVVVDRSHNLFLDISLFSGLIGLIIFSAWFWGAFKRLIKDKSWLLSSLVGFLIFSFFQPIGVVHWAYLAFLLLSYSGTQR